MDSGPNTHRTSMSPDSDTGNCSQARPAGSFRSSGFDGITGASGCGGRSNRSGAHGSPSFAGLRTQAQAASSSMLALQPVNVFGGPSEVGSLNTMASW